MLLSEFNSKSKSLAESVRDLRIVGDVLEHEVLRVRQSTGTYSAFDKELLICYNYLTDAHTEEE